MLKSLTALLFLFIAGTALLIHFVFEVNYVNAVPDKKLYQLLEMQRSLDQYASIDVALFQGTHNSYNSDAYHNLLRYHDRQQRMSIADQLAYGARFIELDTHYTFSFHNFTKDFLLCHGSSKLNILPFHWGCSPFDLPLSHALSEIKRWLEKNRDEVLIFYIEDHSEGQHEALFQLLEQHELVEHIYPSGDCTALSEDITKARVLADGKQILFWKDALRLGSNEIICSELDALKRLAFSDLGVMDRFAEDRTFLGSFSKYLANGEWPSIEPDDLSDLFLQGANIINLDNFVVNDVRLKAFLWSWDYEKTNLEFTDEEEGCALLDAEGDWLLEHCQQSLFAACVDSARKNWYLSQSSIHFLDAPDVCEAEGLVFSAPVSPIENMKLKALLEQQTSKVWLNVRYNTRSQAIEVGDKREFSKR